MTEPDGTLSLAEATGTLSTKGYNLIRKLGEGTYAKVYLATYTPRDDASKKIQLACKVVDSSKAPRDFVRKFLPRELDILKRLNHPHIVHVHSIFQRRVKYYIFMRLAEKGDLLDWVLKHGNVAESQSRVWMRQLSLAVKYLQLLDIAHRDLKCENVLITANYNVKLADFGFARYVVDSKGRQVMSNTNCGSLSYAAPEILGGGHYDPRISDIWSLGVVLFIMLNKAMPFDDRNINRMYEEQINRRYKFCVTVTNILSNQVKKLVHSLLEPDTQRRFQIDQVLSSEWMAMDPRLAVNSPLEEAAMQAAREERARRHRRDATGAGIVIAPLAQPAQSEMREVHEEADIKQHEESTKGMENVPETETSESSDPRADADPTLPRTPEEIDLPVSRPALNIQTQPSHGAISIMETEPLQAAQLPEFMPPELSEKLASKASIQTQRKLLEETQSGHSPFSPLTRENTIQGKLEEKQSRHSPYGPLTRENTTQENQSDTSSGTNMKRRKESTDGEEEQSIEEGERKSGGQNLDMIHSDEHSVHHGRSEESNIYDQPQTSGKKVTEISKTESTEDSKSVHKLENPPKTEDINQSPLVRVESDLEPESSSKANPTSSPQSKDSLQ